VRRLSTTLVIIVALTLTTGIAIGVTGCGTGAQTAGAQAVGAQTVGAQTAALPSADLSPGGILAKAMAASQNMTSAKGTFDVGISFDADVSQLPEEAKALVGQPMKVSGTLAYGNHPTAVEFTVGISAAGRDMNIGMKLLDDKAWFRFMDQWYEAPPEMRGFLGDPSAQKAKVTDIRQLLSDLGIDPANWLKDLRLVGEETVDGGDAYHLAASPDLTKMMTDVVGLMQSGKLMNLLNPAGSGAALGASSSVLPTADELQQMQKQLEAMFTELAADLWIDKEDFTVLKFTAAARMTPPPGEDPAGVNAITLNVAMSLQDINQPVTVEPPTSTQPWTALQKALQENPGILMGPFSGAALGSAPAGPQTSQ
jgi:hypothetical protein